jgi:drug/metabolite transporter (DMT)-like permease
VHWLPLVFLLAFGFGQLFKWSQRRGCSAPVVVYVNYLVLAAALAAYFAWQGQLAFPAAVIRLGMLTGLAFFVSMFTMTRALETANVAVVLTAFRLAILCPIAASVLIWGESAGPGRLLGIVLALISLILMTRGSRDQGLGRGVYLVFFIFLFQGWSQTCLRAVHYVGLDDQRAHVLLVTALTAGLLGLAVSVIRRQRPTRHDLRMGVAIGLYNLLGLLVTLTALSQVQGTVFFPLQGCAVVLMDNVAAHFWWHERLTRTCMAGAALGAVAMLFVL